MRGTGWALLGAVIGIAVDDVLKAPRLHWLVWPAEGLLLVAAVTLALVKTRKRS
jgi:hypothetical protein